jgi:hypothetical protein
LNKISDRSELLLDYLAAGGFSNDPIQENSVIQGFDFAETIRGGRWSQMFGDQFAYLPVSPAGSSFGFGGLGGLSNFAVSSGNSPGSTPGFRQDLLPDQSILTRNAPRISNTLISQTTYALGYRSSLTLMGSYGILKFVDVGLQDSSYVTGRFGYNYLLSPLNSIAISYGFGRLMFSNLPQRADDHTVQLSFARRITGRLSFQVGAGPDVQVYRAPLAGPGTVIGWALYSGLNYQFQHFGTGFNYSHLLTGGSGVLPGAETDMFSAQVSKVVSRWNASISGGYSRNQALQQTLIPSQRITPQGWFTGVQVSRWFTGYGSLLFSYIAFGQSSLAAVCPLTACRTNTLTHTVSIGYNWGPRRIALE